MLKIFFSAELNEQAQIGENFRLKSGKKGELDIRPVENEGGQLTVSFPDILPKENDVFELETTRAGPWLNNYFVFDFKQLKQTLQNGYEVRLDRESLDNPCQGNFLFPYEPPKSKNPNLYEDIFTLHGFEENWEAARKEIKSRQDKGSLFLGLFLLKNTSKQTIESLKSNALKPQLTSSVEPKPSASPVPHVPEYDKSKQKNIWIYNRDTGELENIGSDNTQKIEPGDYDIIVELDMNDSRSLNDISSNKNQFKFLPACLRSRKGYFTLKFSGSDRKIIQDYDLSDMDVSCLDLYGLTIITFRFEGSSKPKHLHYILPSMKRCLKWKIGGKPRQPSIARSIRHKLNKQQSTSYRFQIKPESANQKKSDKFDLSELPGKLADAIENHSLKMDLLVYYESSKIGNVRIELDWEANYDAVLAVDLGAYDFAVATSNSEDNCEVLQLGETESFIPAILLSPENDNAAHSDNSHLRSIPDAMKFETVSSKFALKRRNELAIGSNRPAFQDKEACDHIDDWKVVFWQGNSNEERNKVTSALKMAIRELLCLVFFKKREFFKDISDNGKDLQIAFTFPASASTKRIAEFQKLIEEESNFFREVLANEFELNTLSVRPDTYLFETILVPEPVASAFGLYEQHDLKNNEISNELVTVDIGKSTMDIIRFHFTSRHPEEFDEVSFTECVSLPIGGGHIDIALAASMLQILADRIKADSTFHKDTADKLRQIAEDLLSGGESSLANPILPKICDNSSEFGEWCKRLMRAVQISKHIACEDVDKIFEFFFRTAIDDAFNFFDGEFCEKLVDDGSLIKRDDGYFFRAGLSKLLEQEPMKGLQQTVSNTLKSVLEGGTQTGLLLLVAGRSRSFPIFENTMNLINNNVIYPDAGTDKAVVARGAVLIARYPHQLGPWQPKLNLVWKIIKEDILRIIIGEPIDISVINGSPQSFEERPPEDSVALIICREIPGLMDWVNNESEKSLEIFERFFPKSFEHSASSFEIVQSKELLTFRIEKRYSELCISVKNSSRFQEMTIAHEGCLY